MGWKSLFVLACLVLFSWRAPAQERRYRALVIGNSQYTVKPLAWPATDVRAVAARLRELQYEVTTAENTNNRRLTAALAAFRQKIGTDDVVLLYYAGRVTRAHGVPVLVPLDDLDPDRDLGVPVESVLDALGKSKSAANLVIFDVLAEWPVFGLDIAREWLDAVPKAPARTVVLSSAAAAGRGSLTSEFLHALDEPGTLGRVVEQIERATTRRELFRLDGSVRGDIPAAAEDRKTASQQQQSIPTTSTTTPAEPDSPDATPPRDPEPSIPVAPVGPEPLLARFPTIDAPPSVTTGAPFSVVISLTREERTPAVKVSQVGPDMKSTPEGALQFKTACEPPCEMEVVLSAPGFDFTAGTNTASIQMAAGEDSTPARFTLRALTAGEARLEVTFWYRGAFLARVARTIQVAAFGAAPRSFSGVSSRPAWEESVPGTQR